MSSGEASASPAGPWLWKSKYPLCPQQALTDCGKLASTLHLWARAHVWTRGSRLHRCAHFLEVCVSVGEACRAEDSLDAPRSFFHHAWRLMQCWNALHGHFFTYQASTDSKFAIFVWLYRPWRMRNVNQLQTTPNWSILCWRFWASHPRMELPSLWITDVNRSIHSWSISP